MKRFVDGCLVLICALGGTWMMLDKRVLWGIAYYAAAFFFYVALERATFK